MKLIAFFVIFSITPTLIKADYLSDKNRISILTIYSTISLFFLSLFTFASSIISFVRNRKMRKFSLTEGQVHIYYKDKEKAPKLRRKVLEAMDKGGSVYQKKTNEKSEDNSTTKTLNTESQSSVLNLPSNKDRL